MKESTSSFILEERGNGSNSPFSKGGQGGFEMDVRFISTLNTKEPFFLSRISLLVIVKKWVYSRMGKWFLLVIYIYNN